jgi:hypothetical protein
LEKGLGFPRKLFEVGVMTFPLDTSRLRQPSCFRGPILFRNVGNPEGARHSGLLFFGYFLFAEAKESDLPPGNPRLGGGMIVAQPTSGANRFAQCTLQIALLANFILHNEKQIPRQDPLGMTVHFLCSPEK